LRDLLRDQQALNSDLEAKNRSELVTGGTADVDHLYSTIKGLELQLKASRDEASLLEEQLRTKEARFSEEICRLSSQISHCDDPGVFLESALHEQNGRLLADMEGLKRTVQSLSDNLNLQVLEGQRLHDQLLSDRQLFRSKFERQESEIASSATLLHSLQAVLHCTDAPQILSEVQRLFSERSEARRCLDERLALEQRLAEEVMKARFIREQLAELRPDSVQYEAEVGRVRADLSERQSRWQRERESLAVEVRERDLQIKRLSEAEAAPTENPVYASVFEACVGLNVHFENDFEAPTELTRELATLFRMITDGESIDDALANVDRLAAMDADQLMVLLTANFIQTNDRLARYQEQMDGVRERVERLFERVCAAAERRPARGKGSSIARKGGTKIPLFANATKARAPFVPRNQFAIPGYSPRASPTSAREPVQMHFE
jgi:hypothetical protein